jgi:hypothetical protein
MSSANDRSKIERRKHPPETADAVTREAAALIRRNEQVLRKARRIIQLDEHIRNSEIR